MKELLEDIVELIISIIALIIIISALAYFGSYYWHKAQTQAEQDLANDMEDASLILFEDGSYRAGSQVGCLYSNWGCRPELD